MTEGLKAASEVGRVLFPGPGGAAWHSPRGRWLSCAVVTGVLFCVCVRFPVKLNQKPKPPHGVPTTCEAAS